MTNEQSLETRLAVSGSDNILPESVPKFVFVIFQMYIFVGYLKQKLFRL